jgi:hydroxymethylbilane synthase
MYLHTFDGLELASVTQRQDQSDIFLSHKYSSLDELPKGAVVGTTSLRRRMQLLRKRPDLKVKDLRGNVNTRLRKLAEGQYDAIILAFIGLNRLDLLKDIPYTQKLSLDMMIPPMGQAALGIEIVQGNEKVREIAESLKDDDTFICTQIERDFISKIGAGCSAPVACNAVKNSNEITFRVMLGFPDGTNVMEEKVVCDLSESQNIGIELAQKMIDNGALDLLKRAEDSAFKDEMPQRL